MNMIFPLFPLQLPSEGGGQEAQGNVGGVDNEVRFKVYGAAVQGASTERWIWGRVLLAGMAVGFVGLSGNFGSSGVAGFTGFAGIAVFTGFAGTVGLAGSAASIGFVVLAGSAAELWSAAMRLPAGFTKSASSAGPTGFEGITGFIWSKMLFRVSRCF